MEKVSTGIPTLDLLTGGGFPLYSLNLIAGLPGTGKTTLAQQILFNSPSQERKVLYVASPFEPWAKVMSHQQQFEFFNPERVNQNVFFYDSGPELRREGFQPTITHLLQYIQEQRPALLVLDGFKTLASVAEKPEDVRHLLYDIALQLKDLQMTAIVIGEWNEEDLHNQIEFAAADGVILLATTSEGPFRHRRTIKLLKMRGTREDSNTYSFEIEAPGLVIFASQIVIAHDLPVETKGPVRSGFDDLDTLIEPGLAEGSSLLLQGAPGTAKTIFALQFLYQNAVRFNQKGLYFSFYETQQQLFELAANFGWNFPELEAQGKVKIFSLVEPDLNLDQLLLTIRQAIITFDARRIVLDSLAAFTDRIPAWLDLKAYVSMLTTIIRNAGSIALLIHSPMLPAHPLEQDQTSAIGELVDGLITLRITRDGARRKRTIEIERLRRVRHSVGEQRLKLTQEGLAILVALNESI